ncbi:MAG TPA: hypothetical protein EYN67_00770 [Flavobacteriales bacterium]|nr:hypothetical protein [Flavobacteriales bacterium]
MIERTETRITNHNPKFGLGQVVVTCGIGVLIEADDDFKEQINISIGKHHRGEWGTLTNEDRNQNEKHLRSGERLMSIYYLAYGSPIPDPFGTGLFRTDNKIKIYVITERVTPNEAKGIAERPCTTVLLPTEY